MKKFVAVFLVFTVLMLIAVGAAQAAVLAIISQPVADGELGGAQIGQSFTVPVTGYITTIRLALLDEGASDTLRIYTGGGNSGALLHSQTVEYFGGVDCEFQTIALTTPVAVSAGQVYTLYAGHATWCGVVPGPYAGGEAYAGNTPSNFFDLTFEVVIEGGAMCSGDNKAPDDRINWKHGDNTAILYPRKDAEGKPVLQLYCMSPDGKGTLGDIITQDMFDKAPAKPAVNTKVHETNVCRVPVTFYVLTTGEYQVNIGPDIEGKTHEIIFTGLPPSKVYFKDFNLYRLSK